MMGPIAAVESIIFNYFKFSGRATRAEYWWWGLIQFSFLAFLLFMDAKSFNGAEAPSLNPLAYSSVLFILVTIIPNITVTVRRLHDTGRSGFWMFISMVPIIGGLWHFILMILPSEYDGNIYGTPYNYRPTTGFSSMGGTSGTTKKSNPFQAYAILERADEKPTEEMLAARKQEVSDYYKTRVMQGRS